MTRTVSLVLVSYRSRRVLPGAVESFRAEAARAGLSVEVVVVDHSEDPAEHAALAEARPDVLLARPNRGYAAGVNAGVEASNGAVILAGNPDIEFECDALPWLLRALQGGPHIAGPQFTLAGWLLPPADSQSPAAELARFWATRSRARWRHYLATEVRRYQRSWEAAEPVPTRSLSGALLAFPRAVFERLGRWDEGYFLYFEETDWLLRAFRSGLRSALVPRARVTHHWAHSAEPRTFAQVHTTSRKLYLTTNFGLAGRLAALLRPGHQFGTLPALPQRPKLRPGPVLWLVSPSLFGFPAAGLLGNADVPWAAVEAFAAECPFLSVLTVLACEPAGGKLLGTWRWEGVRG